MLSEESDEIADGSRIACELLAGYAARRSEFGSATAVLRGKVADLATLHAELAHGVMRYSILLEDAAAEAMPRASR
jgi:hypothetical protein